MTIKYTVNIFKNITTIFIILTSLKATAYETDTHEKINEYVAYNAMDNFSLDTYLKEYLGFKNGIQELLKSYKERKAWQWLSDGGIYEDKPPGFQNRIGIVARFLNHFHDPVTDRRLTLLSDYSALFWAQLPPVQQTFGGNYSWHDVRDYYYLALKQNNEYYFTETFRGLGQVMHLVEDMAVPEHVRNDAHIMGAFGLAEHYEQWAKLKYANTPNIDIKPETGTIKIRDAAVSPVLFDYASLLEESKFDEAPVPIANLFDTQQYNGTNPGVTINNNTIGLSEYTNANFLSPDTIFNFWGYDYPRMEDCVERIDPRNNRKYLASTNSPGEKINNLAAVGYLNYPRSQYFPEDAHFKTITLDRYCYEEYAKKLIPRAVGYGAGLLKYFFRGKIDLIPDEDFGYFIKNKTDEEMEGTFELYYDRKNYGRTAVQDSPFPLQTTITANGASQNITFPTPTDSEEPGKYILIFRGRMGNENDAVVGKVISLSSMIAFQSQPGGPGQGNSNIHIIYPDGTGERQITNSGDGLLPYKYGPAWSLDGTKLAFYTETASSGYDIIVVDMTSKEEYPENILYRLDAGFNEFSPSFSPNEEKIAAIRHGATGKNDEIIVFNLVADSWDSLGEVGESGSVMISGGAARSANWSPDGQKIAYCSYPDIGTLKHDIFTIDADTGFKVNVTNSSWASDQEPSWSPDGKYIVFCSDRDGGDHLDIWLYDTDTGQYYQLTDFITSCHSPGFSPDGKKVVFSGYHYAGTPPDEYINYYGIIYLNDIYDGEAGFTILKDPEVLENEPVWSPAFYSPSIDVFEAEPASIPPGGSTTLNWETTNAYSCRIETSLGQDLGCDDLNGSVTVNPSETTTYTITAYGKAGSRVSASVIVTVAQ